MQLEKLRNASGFLASNKTDWIISACLAIYAVVGYFFGFLGEKAALISLALAVLNALFAYYNVSKIFQDWLASKITGKKQSGNK
jgi:uncharacterized membrane protein required for colicin V production